MANEFTVKNDASSGVISPDMEGRIETEAYNSALRECVNFVVLPTGGVTRRPGTRFIMEIPNPDLPVPPNRTIEISRTALNINLFILAGRPSVAGSWYFIVNRGVVVGSESTSGFAIETGIFPEGSNVTLTINENAVITGAGGAGGNGGSQGIAPGTGLPGGIAMNIQYPLTVNNLGTIQGGGTGGAGAAAVYFRRNNPRPNESFLNGYIAGGGGAGGSGYLPGISGLGASNTHSPYYWLPAGREYYNVIYNNPSGQGISGSLTDLGTGGTGGALRAQWMTWHGNGYYVLVWDDTFYGTNGLVSNIRAAAINAGNNIVWLNQGIILGDIIP